MTRLTIALYKTMYISNNQLTIQFSQHNRSVRSPVGLILCGCCAGIKKGDGNRRPILMPDNPLFLHGFHAHQTDLQVARRAQLIHHAHQRFIVH